FNEAERSTVRLVTDAVGRNLQHIFEEGDTPADQNDRKQWQVLTPLHVFETEMTIPRKGHERVGQRQHDNRYEPLHVLTCLDVYVYQPTSFLYRIRWGWSSPRRFFLFSSYSL